MTDHKNYDKNVDTLAKFGPSFQSKAVAVMLNSPDFLAQSFDVINPNFFELDANKWIVKTTLEYFNDYKTLPTLEVFKLEISKDVKDDALRAGIVEQLRGIFQRMTDTDLDYVKDSFLEFGKNQAIKTAIIKSVDLLGIGQYGEIKSIIDAAMRSGQPKTIGHDWKKDIELRLTKNARDVVATGWDVIDMNIGGGLAAGELGVIAAPSGIGKSWALATIGANALKSGKKVIHYTLELNEGYVGLRYDTIYTGIEPGKIPEHPELIRELVGKISGEIIIKYYPAKTVSCHSIQAHVQQLTSLGFKPDILIVDYADLLHAVAKTDARYQELGAIYEELRGLAGELKVPIWTASQTQRCLTLDTLVDTPTGPRELGSLVVGDIVDTHLGFKKVTNVFPIETQGTYEITLKSGKKIRCSARHEFPTAKNTLMSIETGLAEGVGLLTNKKLNTYQPLDMKYYESPKKSITEIEKRVSIKHLNFYKAHRINTEDFIIDDIVDITFLGELETVDVTVEDTHMFYANGIYTHNSSIQDEVIQADKIAESYSKIMTADLVISISRKLEDKMTKTGRAHIIKSRFGPDGQTFPMIIDTYTGCIDILDETSAKGILLKKQMQQGEVATKQNLAKKLADMDFDN